MGNVVAMALVCVPLGCMLYERRRLDPQGFAAVVRRHWILVLVLLFSMIGTVVTGSKAGAGRTHFKETLLFNAEYSAAFARHYRKTASSAYFDTWRCKR